MIQRRTRQHPCCTPPKDQLRCEKETASHVLPEAPVETPSSEEGQVVLASAPSLEEGNAKVDPSTVTAVHAQSVGAQEESPLNASDDMQADREMAPQAVSNQALPSDNTRVHQATDSDSDSGSDCVVVSTGARVAATIVSAAPLLPTAQSGLPPFSISQESRKRQKQTLRMRPRFSFPRCPKTAAGRPAAAKQLKEDVNSLARSSTVYFQSSLPDTQRSGVLNAYLSLLQARHAASKPDGAPQAHLFSTFFFSKLLEGVILDFGAAENDEDWVPGRRTRSGRKRKWRKTQAGNSKSRSTANEASSAAADADEQQVHEALLVNYSAVRTWTVRAQPLQTADVLVIPVNKSNSHWVTIVICIPRKEIVLLDSLFSTGRADEYRSMLLKVWAWLLLEVSDKPPSRFNATSGDASDAVETDTAAAQPKAQAKPTDSSQTMLRAPMQCDAGAEAGASMDVAPVAEPYTRGTNEGTNGVVQQGPASKDASATCAHLALEVAAKVAEQAASAATNECASTPVQAHCFVQQDAYPSNGTGVDVLAQRMHGSQASVGTYAAPLEAAAAAPKLGGPVTQVQAAVPGPAIHFGLHGMHACTHDAEQQWRRTRRTQRSAVARASGADAALPLENCKGEQPAHVTRSMGAEHPDRHTHDGPQAAAAVSAGNSSQGCAEHDRLTDKRTGSGQCGAHEPHTASQAGGLKRKTRASSTKVTAPVGEPVAEHGAAHASGDRAEVRVRRRVGAAAERDTQCSVHDAPEGAPAPSVTPPPMKSTRAFRSRHTGASSLDQVGEIEAEDDMPGEVSVLELTPRAAAAVGSGRPGGFVDVVPPQPCSAASMRSADGQEWLEGWRLRAAGGVPQQRDGGSCGVFSLAFADCVMRGWWPSSDHVPEVNFGADDEPADLKRSRGNGRAARNSGGKHGSQSEALVQAGDGQSPGSKGPAVSLEFGEVAALRLGLLQELTSTAQYEAV